MSIQTILSNSIEQSPFVNSHSASQEIHDLLCNRNMHYRDKISDKFCTHFLSRNDLIILIISYGEEYK
jgi:hypothetical protein